MASGDITAELINRITEELRSNDYKLIPSPVTFLNKLADAQEYLCVHCKAMRKNWDVALKPGVLEYPFDDSIVNVHRIRYQDEKFIQYDVITKQIYSFSDDIVITGDAGNQLSELKISGASVNNTSNGVIWWRIKASELSVSKVDSEIETDEVMKGIPAEDSLPQTVILEEVNNSGMSGSVKIASANDDTDRSNNKFTFDITTSRRTLKLNKGLEISEGDKITMVTFVKPKFTERISETVDPVIDITLHRYLVKLVLSEYRGAVVIFDSKETVKEEAMQEAMILNMDDVASVKKSSRNTMYW